MLTNISGRIWKMAAWYSAPMRLNTDWEAFGGKTKRVMRKTIPDVVPAFSGMLFSLQ